MNGNVGDFIFKNRYWVVIRWNVLIVMRGNIQRQFCKTLVVAAPGPEMEDNSRAGSPVLSNLGYFH